jgi:hypothetical protein
MLKVLAALEIIGGLLGYGFLNAYVWPRYGFGLNLFNLVSLGFFSLCLVAGIELGRGQRRGLLFSLLAQLPQLLMFNGINGGYKLQAGLQALITLQPTGLGFWLGLGAESLFGRDAAKPAELALNVAPILGLVLLLRASRRLRPRPPVERAVSTERPA